MTILDISDRGCVKSLVAMLSALPSPSYRAAATHLLACYHLLHRSFLEGKRSMPSASVVQEERRCVDALPWRLPIPNRKAFPSSCFAVVASRPRRPIDAPAPRQHRCRVHPLFPLHRHQMMTKGHRRECWAVFESTHPASRRNCSAGSLRYVPYVPRDDVIPRPTAVWYIPDRRTWIGGWRAPLRRRWP